jgi:dihydrofolate reductase
MVVLDLTVSLDGFVAGPDASLEAPLGLGGEQLHQWLFDSAAWRARHGLEGGGRSVDDEVVREWLDVPGAVVMGRRMFSGGTGPWTGDPNANGWWGDDPPFPEPVFVVTSHARDPLALGDATFTFVGGVGEALAEARTAAGGRPVLVAGGANLAQQCLAAGLLDRIRLHVAPVVLGGGVRLFEEGETARLELERVRAGAVAHLDLRVLA